MRAAWLVLLGACYQESSGVPCTLTCDQAPCPGDQVCGSDDHLCHAPGMPECSVTGSGSGSAAYIKATTPASGAQFGTSVALSADGSLLAVGAPGEANGGALYVYQWDGTAYAFQTRLVGAHTGAGDQLGASVAMSANGGVIVAGAPLEDGSGVGIDPADDNNAPDAGAVIVFTGSKSVWKADTYKTGHAGAQLGASIAITSDGTWFAVGAPAPVSGTFPVYAWKVGNLVAIGQIATVSDINDHLGASVAIRDDAALVLAGADREDSAATGVGGDAMSNAAPDSGAVDLFGAGAGPTALYVKASNTGQTDRFGFSIASSAAGDVFAVGAPGEDSAGAMSDNSATNAGAVYMFAGSGSAVAQTAYVKAPSPAAGDQFGQALALARDGMFLVVGAPTASSTHGSAFVYSGSGSNWQVTSSPLAAFNGDAGDFFGGSIAVSNDHAVIAIGAPDEASASATDPNDNSAVKAGAVYVFR